MLWSRWAEVGPERRKTLGSMNSSRLHLRYLLWAVPFCPEHRRVVRVKIHPPRPYIPIDRPTVGVDVFRVAQLDKPTQVWGSGDFMLLAWSTSPELLGRTRPFSVPSAANSNSWFALKRKFQMFEKPSLVWSSKAYIYAILH